jgi:putative hydrolase of the HAD superfamily
MGMKIQAVFFDMGGTIETYGYTRELRLKATPGLRQILACAGIELPLSDEQLLETVSAGLERYKRWSIPNMVELPSAQVWSEYVFPELPLDAGNLSAISEDLMFYIETNYYDRKMRPEVPDVLEKIRKMGLKIGLISNVNSRGQVPANLSQYGIRHYFDPIVLSSEYGYRKPDPAIFHYAARLADVPTSQCAYIGDRVVRDIDGARRAGFGLAIHIRHDFEHGEKDEGATPDATIDDMTSLPGILCSAAGDETIHACPSKTRALIFDAGDILYYRPERGRKFSAFLEELALTVVDNQDVLKKEYKAKAYHGQITQEEYWEAILRLNGVTQPEQLARGMKILKEAESDICFFDGVRETLVELKRRGYLLGIITDTANSVRTKLQWFERGGFGHVWDSIISSQELGISKPHPQVYHAALHQLGLTSDEAVFVGHKATELDGACAVEMMTVAFNYETGAKADFHINAFAELLDLPPVSSSLH